ncbi:hypothetical protein EDC01DRAFT_624735 [Geopyxis carbonaria]|nr:hypothetical protein EDC01DRAFT_624735 [Geopyxis carbonaria]
MFSQIVSTTGTNPTSYRYTETAGLSLLPVDPHTRPLSAVIDGDPYDIAVYWQDTIYWQNTIWPPVYYGSRSSGPAPPLSGRASPTERVLVLNTANEKKPGGDWDGGVLGLGAEESLARRSNLVQTLTTMDRRSSKYSSTYYPLNQTGGIYSPNTVVFRSGPERDYRIWPETEWTTISVVSVPAVRRPKVDGIHYAFDEEKDLQREKMKSVLRIAADNGHVNLVLTGFGSCGPGIGAGPGDFTSASPPTHSTYRNPVADVAELWDELIHKTPEFKGYFKKVVFAIGGSDAQRTFRQYFG